MHIIRTIPALRQHVQSLRTQGDTIGFVPTMGALHEGHISLVKQARNAAKRVVVSIFVNPAQFAPHEDFDAYPRQEAADLAKLEAVGVDVVYLPAREVMYPQSFDISFKTGAIGQQLEGVARPHFFDGVALVVTKLFMQVQPDIAVFGEKDFQQLHVIRKLVSALDIPVQVLGGEIIREENGLAMSSRNAYLSEAERTIAASLYATLQTIVMRLRAGENITDTLAWGTQHLQETGFARVDYLELRDSHTLAPTHNPDGARLLVAAYLGKVRLLDNVAV